MSYITMFGTLSSSVYRVFCVVVARAVENVLLTVDVHVVRMHRLIDFCVHLSIGPCVLGVQMNRAADQIQPQPMDSPFHPARSAHGGWVVLDVKWLRLTVFGRIHSCVQ